MKSSQLGLIALLIAAGAIALWLYNKRSQMTKITVSEKKGLCNPAIHGTQGCLECCRERFDPEKEPVDIANCTDNCMEEEPTTMGD